MADLKNPSARRLLEYRERDQPRWQWRSLLERLGPLLALIVLIVLTAACEKWTRGTNAFLKPENWANIVRQWSFVGIIAIGMTFVIISGGIDLSVGSLLALAGGAGVWLMNTAIVAARIVSDNEAARKQHLDDISMGIDVPLTLPFGALREWLARLFASVHLGGSEAAGVAIAFVAIVLIALLCGWLNGVLVAKGRIAPFIATLGTMAAFRSLVMVLLDGSEIRSESPRLFVTPGNGPWPAISFFAIAVLAAVVLRMTRYGRYVIAVGANERAAIYSAVNVDRVKLLTYTLVGGCCGIAALLLASRMNSIASSSAGVLYELDAIAAVAIGGTRMRGGSGSIFGTVVGVLILGVIGNMLGILNVSPYLQGTVKGGIIIAAVLVQRVNRRGNE
jgi:ribose transport system permease protein